MNRDDLRRQLDELKVNPNSYSLDGGCPSESYVLSDEGNGVWSVYYSERGNRSSEIKFNSESDACVELKRRLLSDSSSRWWPPTK